ncbi:double-strand break repair helicase AddA [Mangrovicella endophytica]|uniref:double-strand break repair helicase AddA n=1 Tax=Mangrovicella endophytica TaxID=2066697 RepID=UPI000C9E71F1|nr:double-strand break repair helicase AddA [Mangrovicella endophytica]
MTGFVVSEATRAAQATASDPALSVFVSANAGSGKTHVLTERVVRLLLAGAEPSKVLCLTYTKAAAAEMSNRVFARLAAWATADEAALKSELSRLTSTAPSREALADARRLFAKALDTPGGLKIQTIHAFCEAILHQFPLEANVPGYFEVLDDAESALLLAEARRLLITRASDASALGPDAALLADSFAEALSLGGEFGLDGLISEIVRKRDAIRRHVEEAGGLDEAIALMRTALDVGEDEDEAALLSTVWPCPHLDPESCRALATSAAASSSASDGKLATRLASFAEGGTGGSRFEAYVALVLDSKGLVRASIRGFATKAVAAAVPDIEERLARAGERCLELQERLASLRLFRASRAALVIADRLETDYAALKRRRGRLDFEDLIVRTADLLSRSEASSWVHYKLDQGIDHVLIDEAQDTSPRQWQVMRQLVEEFFAGASARPGVRTVFAVGDEKQSIYSFQGASPAMFAGERRDLERRAAEAALTFRQVALHQSFRSAADVLQAVDAVFADPSNRRGLSSDGEAPVHESARGAEPGLVEIWPVVQAESVAEPRDWLTPLDVQPENAPANRLAQRIAATIRDWIGQPVRHKGVVRAITPGDVLILVRKRSGFVEAMNRALRDVRIAVAGADRLVITDHIAVQDLIALGRTVANAEDDLSLAAVLKSPLFGFSDDELMALALSRHRDEGLYLGLRRLAGAEGPARIQSAAVATTAEAALLAKAANAFTRLESLRDRAGFEPVFDFYARVLGPDGGRRKLIERLGHDAGEVLDAFLDLALAEERAGRTGLDAFLETLAASPPEIKREMEHGKDEVRIMTIHASKGLEAPVVFLVDPGSAPSSHTHGARLMEWEDMPGLYPGQQPGFLWRAAKPLENGAVAALREREKNRAEDEYRRLLYVGMTRAADRLVVCGTAGVRGPHADSWLQRVEAAVGGTCREILDPEGKRVAWRFGSAEPDSAAAIDGAANTGGSGARTAVDGREDATYRGGRRIELAPLPPEVLPPRPLTPSSAGGAALLDREEDVLAAAAAGYVSPVLGDPAAMEPSQAIQRGRLVHRLLQVLPELTPQERRTAGEHYLAASAGGFAAEAREAMLDQVLAVLDAPHFAALFAPGSRAEVSVAGQVVLGERFYPVSGTVDRMAVTEEVVTIVDYKTNRPAPTTLETVPQPHILQLALYRALLQPLYPGRTIEALLLFTEGPTPIPVPGEVMEAALAARARKLEKAA